MKEVLTTAMDAEEAEQHCKARGSTLAPYFKKVKEFMDTHGPPQPSKASEHMNEKRIAAKWALQNFHPPCLQHLSNEIHLKFWIKYAKSIRYRDPLEDTRETT